MSRAAREVSKPVKSFRDDKEKTSPNKLIYLNTEAQQQDRGWRAHRCTAGMSINSSRPPGVWTNCQRLDRDLLEMETQHHCPSTGRATVQQGKEQGL